MRAALWLLALFAVAVATALFAGNNQGTVTLFWPPWRVDLSLNLVLLLLAGGFVVVHAALRALAALFEMPQQARRWRAQQKERAMVLSMLDAYSQMIAGRFVRARKSALAVLAQERTLARSEDAPIHGPQIRALAHLLVAESAQALQDRAAREEHLKNALEHAPAWSTSSALQATHEGVLLRAARWSLDDRDAPAAVQWLASLPQGAARRTMALRIKLKAARQARKTTDALDTARLLAKHRAFSPLAAQSILRGLAMDLLDGAHDTAQLRRAWDSLETTERAIPELAIHAAQRLTLLREEAKKAGLNLELNLMDASAGFKSMLEKKHQSAWMAWSSGRYPAYWEHFHKVNANKPQTNNIMNLDDDAISALVEQYDKAFDFGKKAELSRQIQQRLYELASFVPAYQVPYTRAGAWRWIKLPKTPATPQSDLLYWPLDGANSGYSFGGLLWIDEQLKAETKAAIKQGKTFPPVTVIDTRYQQP